MCSAPGRGSQGGKNGGASSSYAAADEAGGVTLSVSNFSIARAPEDEIGGESSGMMRPESVYLNKHTFASFFL